MDSINIAFVFSLIAFLKFSGHLITNTVFMPYLGSVIENKLYVPPYKVLAETISSPVPAIFITAQVIAAEPEATAKAPTPPSNAAILF